MIVCLAFSLVQLAYQVQLGTLWLYQLLTYLISSFAVLGCFRLLFSTGTRSGFGIKFRGLIADGILVVCPLV
jgi:hypothetical protein